MSYFWTKGSLYCWYTISYAPPTPFNGITMNLWNITTDKFNTIIHHIYWKPYCATLLSFLLILTYEAILSLLIVEPDFIFSIIYDITVSCFPLGTENKYTCFVYQLYLKHTYINNKVSIITKYGLIGGRFRPWKPFVWLLETFHLKNFIFSFNNGYEILKIGRKKILKML